MGLKAVHKQETEDGTILVADGFISPSKDPTDEFPFGYYKTAWAIERDNMHWGMWLEFDAFHDPGHEVSDKQNMRIAAALKSAHGWIDIGREQGLYG